MSRKVAEDLSGLSFKEKMGKKFDNFKVWVYNPEDKTIMGERHGKEWGMLLGYYLIFYLLLAGFTAIFFGILAFMLPNQPVELVPGLCSQRANAFDSCGKGPFFQVLDLNDVEDERVPVYTDEILRFSVCEPAMVGIPRELPLFGKAPVSYTRDDARRGYSMLALEAARVLCKPPFNDAIYNPACGSRQPIEDNVFNVLPLIPKGANQNEFMSPTEIRDQAIPAMSPGDTYTSPSPVYNFEVGGKEYSTYMVFFRFNKVWNFQPYHNEKSSNDQVGKLAEEPIENSIGLTCSWASGCTSGQSMNYNGTLVECDQQNSADGRLRFDLLSNVMTNFDGFPWRGGALNMNFGSVAVTVDVKDNSPVLANKLLCTMGVDVENGLSGVGESLTGIPASSMSIANFNKQAYARAYSRSNGREVEIDVY